MVAETEEQARAALALIEVDYEELPAVTDPVAARRDDAPVLHPDRPTGNLLKHIKVRQGDVDQGFAAADVIVERTYRTPMTEHAFLSPSAPSPCCGLRRRPRQVDHLRGQPDSLQRPAAGGQEPGPGRRGRARQGRSWAAVSAARRTSPDRSTPCWPPR
ncbi:MAG: hypothetical protein R2854_27240 [Caldilineaceae bacterium]